MLIIGNFYKVTQSMENWKGVRNVLFLSLLSQPTQFCIEYGVYIFNQYKNWIIFVLNTSWQKNNKEKYNQSKYCEIYHMSMLDKKKKVVLEDKLYRKSEGRRAGKKKITFCGQI